MKITIFLGAGASTPFDKPTTYELRRKLRDKYQDNEYLIPLIDHFPSGDIEDILQTIKDVMDFSNNRGGKFISEVYNVSFDPEPKFHRFSNDKGKQKNIIEYDEFIKKLKEINTLVEKEIFLNYQWRHDYDQHLRNIWSTIMDVFEDDEVHIGTTNYDRVIEEFCILSEKYTCVDGFIYDESKGKFTWMPNKFTSNVNANERKKILLYKLHGSLNWKNHNRHGIVRTDEESKPLDENYTENLLIYPTVSPKDGTILEPFKTIRSKFEEHLDKSDFCIVIGFSFRDSHVNELFKNFITKGKKLLVISPNAREVLFEKGLLGMEYKFRAVLGGFLEQSKNILVINNKLNIESLPRIIKIIKNQLEGKLPDDLFDQSTKF